MAASINDLITKASNGTAPVATTLASQKNNGATSASLALATGWNTTTAVHGLMYKVDANNNYVQGTLLVWKGVLSGTTINNFTIKSGTDDNYAAGSVVELAPTSAWADDLAAGILVDHDTLGRAKQLTDTNGNVILDLSPVSSAVNRFQLLNAATGGKPVFQVSGSDTNASGSIKGKGTGLIDVDGAVPQKFFALYDFVESGCVWSGDSYGASLNASMTSGFVWIGGKRLTVAAVTSRAFASSNDTYIYLTDNNDGTAAFTYSTVANNAASPSAPAGGLLVGIIVAGANIASAGSVNQGQQDKVLPIASSVPYAVTDSLGNLICPRDPNRRIIGYRQQTSSQGTSSSSVVQITALSCPVIVPTNRKVKVSVWAGNFSASGTAVPILSIWDGTVGSGTQLATAQEKLNDVTITGQLGASAVVTPATSSKTYNAGMLSQGAAATVTLSGSSTTPSFILVELE